PEVQALRRKAADKGVYVSAGIAEQDAAGKRWNTQLVIDPRGELLGWHHKIWLTKEKGFTEAGTDHHVFDVKGLKLGIATCADGRNLAQMPPSAQRSESKEFVLIFNVPVAGR